MGVGRQEGLKVCKSISLVVWQSGSLQLLQQSTWLILLCLEQRFFQDEFIGSNSLPIHSLSRWFHSFILLSRFSTLRYMAGELQHDQLPSASFFVIQESMAFKRLVSGFERVFQTWSRESLSLEALIRYPDIPKTTMKDTMTCQDVLICLLTPEAWFLRFWQGADCRECEFREIAEVLK